MTRTTRDDESLVELLEEDPGRFEPSTAFRVSRAVGESTVSSTQFGIMPAAVPVTLGRRGQRPARGRSTLIGLLGPLGALPPSYNDLAIREDRNKSGSLVAFLELFAARLDELFVAACEKYRLPRLLRWSDATDSRNGFVTALMALTGFGTMRLRETSGVHDDVLLRFSGFFAARTRNAANLQSMLTEFCGLPVRIDLFRPRWLPVPEHEQSQMNHTGSVRLGINAMAGAAILDLSSGFRVVIGPLDYREYLSLSPDSRNMREVFALTRLYVGTGLDFDVQIVLKKDEVPFCQLGQAADPPRLGWNSWARAAPAGRDSDDAIVTAHHLALGQAS